MCDLNPLRLKLPLWTASMDRTPACCERYLADHPTLPHHAGLMAKNCPEDRTVRALRFGFPFRPKSCWTRCMGSVRRTVLNDPANQIGTRSFRRSPSPQSLKITVLERPRMRTTDCTPANPRFMIRETYAPACARSRSSVALVGSDRMTSWSKLSVWLPVNRPRRRR